MGTTEDAIAKDQIKGHEGYRGHVYLDPLGLPTGGWGHHFYDGSRLPRKVNEMLFDMDYGNAVRDYHSLKFEGVNTARRTALIDMIFNMGLFRFGGFKKMIAAIRDGDWDTAAAEAQNSKWYKQVGKRGETIVRQLKTGVL